MGGGIAVLWVVVLSPEVGGMSGWWYSGCVGALVCESSSFPFRQEVAAVDAEVNLTRLHIYYLFLRPIRTPLINESTH